MKYVTGNTMPLHKISRFAIFSQFFMMIQLVTGETLTFFATDFIIKYI